MASAALTEDYSCGYCLQRLTYMTDPRELPCSHIFCLPCIQADYEKFEKIDCRICGQTHLRIFCESLKRSAVLVVGESANEDGKGNTFIHCDLCQDKESWSVRFCADCNKRLCADHLKMHEESLKLFLKKAHSLVSITEYARNSSKYEKTFCPEHEQEYQTQVCEKCKQVFCFHCSVSDSCEGGEAGGSHRVTLLEKFSEKVRVELKASMRKLSEKISQLSQLEKTAWSNLDKLEVKVKEMNEEVDEVAEKQICEIKKNSTEVKSQLKEFLARTSIRTEEYALETEKVKDELEEVWRAANKKLIRNNDLEVIRQQEANLQWVESTIADAIMKPRPLFNCSLKYKGSFRGLGLKFTSDSYPPVDLELAKQEVSISMQKICWTNKGSLYASLSGQKLSLMNADAALENSADQPGNIVALSVTEQVVAFATKVVSGSYKSFFEVSLCAADFTNKKSICKFDTNSQSSPAPFLLSTVPHTHQLVIINTQTKEFKAYTKNGTLRFSLPLSGLQHPAALHALDDGRILIADSGSVSKYQIDGTRLQWLWTCSNLNNVQAISVDTEGYIYCLTNSPNPNAGKSIKNISVISQEGKLTGYLTHPQMASRGACDITVSSANQMAVACDSSGLVIFNILRQSHY